MSRALTYEQIRDYINGEEGNGCKLLLTKEQFEQEKNKQNEYGSRVKLKIQCGCINQNIFYTSLYDFKNRNKRQCKSCSGQVWLSYEDVKNYIEVESNSGCKLLTDEKTFKEEKIKQSKSSTEVKIEIQCNCGNKFITNYETFKRGNKRQCNDCGRKDVIEKRRYDYCFVKQYIYKLGYILLNKTYKRNSDKLIIKDKEGYYYSSTFDSLLLNKEPYAFYKSNPYTIQNIKLWCKINNKPFILLSTEYKGSNKKLKWLCLKENCRDVFYISWDSIRSGQGCSVCHGQQVGDSNCLATNYPELSKQWHPTKNGSLTPYDVVCGSDKHVWWICPLCGNEWQAQIASRLSNGCPKCAIEKHKGKNNNNWKGGISSLQDCFRNKIYTWKRDSMIMCNYKCIITENKFDIIHHIFPFFKIIDLMLQDKDVTLKNKINEYSDIELKNMEQKCLELHYQYGLGICLCLPIHKLFHKVYGNRNNTPQQFLEFIQKLEQHEFDDYLEENKLKLNINYEILNKLLNQFNLQYISPNVKK